MYGKLPDEVMSTNISMGAKVLYAAITLRAFGSGVCTASSATLGADIGADERTVRRLRSELEQRGFVSVTYSGKGHSTRCLSPLISCTPDNSVRLTPVTPDNSVRLNDTTPDNSVLPPGQICPPTPDRSVRERKKIKYNSKKDIVRTADCADIVSFLNEKTGSDFKPTTAATQKLIHGRLDEGYTVEDFKAVVAFKAAQWSGTDMEKYLRPATLFNPSKFESYLQEARKVAPKPVQQEPQEIEDWAKNASWGD